MVTHRHVSSLCGRSIWRLPAITGGMCIVHSAFNHSWFYTDYPCMCPPPKRAMLLVSLILFLYNPWNKWDAALVIDITGLVFSTANRTNIFSELVSVVFIFVLVLFICVIFSSVPPYSLPQRQQHWQADRKKQRNVYGVPENKRQTKWIIRRRPCFLSILGDPGAVSWSETK